MLNIVFVAAVRSPLGLPDLSPFDVASSHPPAVKTARDRLPACYLACLLHLGQEALESVLIVPDDIYICCDTNCFPAPEVNRL